MHWLGLYLSKAIIAAHGGRIDVESTLGEGSTFRVHIPFA
jgi:signal transduction histidine kinase